MVSWPVLGTRVSVRYRRPAGSDPPQSDAVGFLRAIQPSVLIETKTGDAVRFAAADALMLRVLTDVPVRTSQIRAVEHAAARAWPGTEQRWLDGWLLRAGHGVPLSANSAVPLEMSAQAGTIPTILDWYAERNLTPWLAVPDRLVRLPADLAHTGETRALVGEVPQLTPQSARPDTTLSATPNPAWLTGCGVAAPAEAFTAVTDGEVMFATGPGGATARGAVTDSPDGTRWVGLSMLTVGSAGAEAGIRSVGEALLAWGAGRGATGCYAHLRYDDAAAIDGCRALGLVAQHRCRYIDGRDAARWLAGPTRSV